MGDRLVRRLGKQKEDVGIPFVMLLWGGEAQLEAGSGLATQKSGLWLCRAVNSQ